MATESASQTYRPEDRGWLPESGSEAAWPSAHFLSPSARSGRQLGILAAPFFSWRVPGRLIPTMALLTAGANHEGHGVLTRRSLDMRTGRSASRIAAAALDRIARSGYAQTTLSTIAAGAGVTEVIVQDTFGTKEALVAELTQPLLEQLEVLVRAAGSADSNDPDQVAAVLGKYLATLVAHRQLVEVLLGDPAAATCPAVVRLRSGLLELRDELAGPGEGLGGRIRASSALGAVQQAVADSSDVELLATRAVIIQTATAILVTEHSP